MDRIFLAVIVSGLLLATTSTALLVVSRDGPLMLAAMSPQTAGLRGDELTARQIEEDQFTPSDGRSGRTRF